MAKTAECMESPTSNGLSRNLPRWVPAWVARRLDEHMREVIAGAAVTFTVKVVGSALMFAFNVVVARLLGAEQTGLFFLALTVLQVCAVLGLWGLDNATLKFVAANAELGEWGRVLGVYRKAVIFTAGLAVPLGFAVFVAAPVLACSVFQKPELTGALRAAAVGVPAVALLWIHSEALKGLKRMLASQSLQSLILPITALLTVPVAARWWGATGAVAVYAVAAYAAVVGGYGFWRRHTAHSRAAAAAFPGRNLVDTAKPLGAVAATNLVIQWLPLLVLGAVGTKADVGVFGAALRTAMLTSLLLVAVNSMTAPKFAALWAKGDLPALEQTAVKSAALVALAAAPILSVLAFFPKHVLGLFGQGFASGSVALTILAAGQFVNAATGSVGCLLMMTGNGKWLWVSVVLGAMTCVGLSSVIPVWNSVIAAAIAVAVPLAMQNIAASVFSFWRIRVAPCNYRALFSK
ncbi:Membrane protein involved in the export of O-antigen and teichoic acid [Desulfacinum hydrothermale DSM 13146]|uniref:Membrane protein involved in the export of O-antigen and teichoic acid n=1 Tax=Desulfacinum hydrothermale DSM 13146 TaxID=1121390 RepID=A0A1W1XRF4_9BACT|nr:oligosaccharide flippase family protein [Desulfacinum hydrothermale]SMC26476.1 Membrane protein involved in the export of O-antigen and teichoic acid [Desulfacinum hydrothermale DSM 13146]